MKKVLFMVPHEDDELFVGGQLLINLVRNENYDVKVFIATNGDYYPYEHKYRIKESIKVLKIIGLEEKDIIFGGYGDCWRNKHIYNAKSDEIKESMGGYKSTYLDGRNQEWHYNQYSDHQDYTRTGYLNDIKSLIEIILPDVIICVDMDTHRDHRCLSLLTEEALGIILKSNILYRPVLLKKFAYQEMLFGKYDFFEYPHRRSLSDSEEMWNPFLKWKERISYISPPDCDTLFLHTNFMYKLVKMYKTQGMWVYAPSFINRDIVFWKRNVNNEVLNSNISVSSGEKKYLNDFKLIDTSDVEKIEVDYSELCWRPDSSDDKREIRVDFSTPISLKEILIYFNCPGGLKGKYYIISEDSLGSDKVYEMVIETPEDFLVENIGVSESNCRSLRIVMSDLHGNVGIGEIEALSYRCANPFEEYLYDEKNNSERKKVLLALMLFWEKIFFKIEKMIYYRTDSWIRKRKEYDGRRI